MRTETILLLAGLIIVSAIFAALLYHAYDVVTTQPTRASTQCPDGYEPYNVGGWGLATTDWKCANIVEPLEVK